LIARREDRSGAFSYKSKPIRIKSFRLSPTKKERNGEKERGEVAL